MRYFSDDELKCKCGCGQLKMDPGFIMALNRLRDEYGKPIILSSAYRCPEYNRSIGGGPAHEGGVAVDIKVYGGNALRIIALAGKYGFTGIGVKQHGEGRFIHIDMVEPDKYVSSPRPWIWSYK